jgi:hypothetical protein
MTAPAEADLPLVNRHLRLKTPATGISIAAKLPIPTFQSQIPKRFHDQERPLDPAHGAGARHD